MHHTDTGLPAPRRPPAFTDLHMRYGSRALNRIQL